MQKLYVRRQKGKVGIFVVAVLHDVKRRAPTTSSMPDAARRSCTREVEYIGVEQAESVSQLVAHAIDQELFELQRRLMRKINA